jgi:Zn-dependent protease
MTIGFFNGPGRPWMLGRVRGIPIRLQPLLLVLMGLLALMEVDSGGWTSGLMTFFALSLVMGSVLLHELGHALMAQRLGVQVVDITLWPLGGIAMMVNMPEDPATEGAIAIAGPLVNFAIAGIASMILMMMGLLGELIPMATITQAGLPQILALLVMVNVIMGTFNLVPAFPMDGGKLLRSFLARKDGWVRGTERAAQVGRIFAWAMVFFGWRWSLMLPFLGFYLLFAGKRELIMVQLKHAAQGAGGMFGGNLEEMLRRATQAGGFNRPGQEPHGQAPSHEGHPGETHVDSSSQPKRGFSEEDIRQLEADRGRLRKD